MVVVYICRSPRLALKVPGQAEPTRQQHGAPGRAKRKHTLRGRRLRGTDPHLLAQFRAAWSREIHTSHLPRCHIAKVTPVRIVNLLDGDHLHAALVKNRLFEPLLWIIAPQAWRYGKVALLVKPVCWEVAGAILRKLRAQQRLLAGRHVPDVETHGFTARRVAMAAGIQQAHTANRPLQGDRVDALAIRPIWAGACARRARRRHPDRPIGIANDGWTLGTTEGRRHIVLRRRSLGLVVDSVQVRVRGHTSSIYLILLEPEAKLLMIPEDLSAERLAGLLDVEHELLVLAALQATSIGAREARRVLLLHQGAVGPAVLLKLLALAPPV